MTVPRTRSQWAAAVRAALELRQLAADDQRVTVRARHNTVVRFRCRRCDQPGRCRAADLVDFPYWFGGWRHSEPGQWKRSRQSRCTQCPDPGLGVSQIIWETKKAAAFQALRDADLEPIYFLYDTNKSHPCQCMCCGRGYSPRIWNVWKKGGMGCAHCARRRSMSLEPTQVYVLLHERADAVKVGISRQRFAPGHNRVRAHERRGWRLHRSLTLRTARLAYDIEQAVIDRLRLDLHAPPADVDMPQYGRTETAPAALVSPALLWDLVCGEAGRLITETSADHRDRPPRPARGRNNFGRPTSVEDVRWSRLHQELPEGAWDAERHRSARSCVADQQREAAYAVWGEHYAPYGIWNEDTATIQGSRYHKKNVGIYLSRTNQTARERRAYAAWVTHSSTS